MRTSENDYSTTFVNKAKKAEAATPQSLGLKRYAMVSTHRHVGGLDDTAP